MRQKRAVARIQPILPPGGAAGRTANTRYGDSRYSPATQFGALTSRHASLIARPTNATSASSIGTRTLQIHRKARLTMTMTEMTAAVTVPP